jgi:hypothetical protein
VIAMLTISLFILDGDPSENCTAQGIPNRTMGAESGGISACSAGLAAQVRWTFSSVDDVTLVIH